MVEKWCCRGPGKVQVPKKPSKLIGLIKSITKKKVTTREVKAERILNAQRINHAKVLIETGTYYGDMVLKQKNNFERIYTIELSKELFNGNKERLKGIKNVKQFLGDSPTELKKILNKVNESCVFWLDAHYSGVGTARLNKNTPIEEELDVIIAHIQKTNLNHIILIDDAYDFVGANEYPDLKELVVFLKRRLSDFNVIVKYDIIEIKKEMKK